MSATIYSKINIISLIVWYVFPFHMAPLHKCCTSFHMTNGTIKAALSVSLVALIRLVNYLVEIKSFLNGRMKIVVFQGSPNFVIWKLFLLRKACKFIPIAVTTFCNNGAIFWICFRKWFLNEAESNFVGGLHLLTCIVCAFKLSKLSYMLYIKLWIICDYPYHFCVYKLFVWSNCAATLLN